MLAVKNHGGDQFCRFIEGGKSMRFVSQILGVAAAFCLSTAISAVQPAQAQQVITLNGAVQFNDDHAFNKALLKFEELVKKYYGKPINFVLHRNSSLGLEKQYCLLYTSPSPRD